MFYDKAGQRRSPLLIPASQPDVQTVEIHNDCTGSPNCTVELRIEQHYRNGSSASIELHLSAAEVKFLRKWMKKGLRGSRIAKDA